MEYRCNYNSPLGKIIMSANKNELTGLWFECSRYNEQLNKPDLIFNDDLSVFVKVKLWLSRYFRGENPAPSEIPIRLIGSDFSISVWNILTEIPYGETVTYGDIAKKMALQNNILKMSAQAVGGAVGLNPISIIVPCHRVIGANKKLTGYSAGIDIKYKLLELEKGKQIC